jgi:hypothetical protein
MIQIARGVGVAGAAPMSVRVEQSQRAPGNDRVTRRRWPVRLTRLHSLLAFPALLVFAFQSVVLHTLDEEHADDGNKKRSNAWLGKACQESHPASYCQDDSDDDLDGSEHGFLFS